MIMTENQVFRRIQSNPRVLGKSGNSSTTFVIFSNHQQQQQPTLNVLLRPSRSNNNLRYHVRHASSILPQQPSSYESLRRKRYLMESRNALYFPPVATTICVLFFGLYLFRERLNVLAEDDVYVSWQKVITEKQIWRLFIAQFFHFSRASVLINMFTLYAIGRYLERKVTTVAMFSVIIIMSVVSHLLYILLNPYLCTGIQTEYIWGFGNVVYSLRVMLAYALEPRNYERDLVFGLYPMVLSANAAPWQPVLDLIIFKIVLPEQCITGQFSGIVAGFIVTFVLLVWPTKGIYIASPPDFWVPDQEPDAQNPSNGRSSGSWKMETHPSPYFFMSPPSETTIRASRTRELNPRQVERIRTNDELIQITSSNALQRNSDELKRRLSHFFVSAKESLVRKLGEKSGDKVEGRESNKNCKLLHKRRRKRRSRKGFIMDTDFQQPPPPLSTRMSERSSGTGSVSSIDPECLSGDFAFKSNLETVPVRVYN